MFDLPDAKRVRRSDLYPRSSSTSPTPSEPDTEVEAELRARLTSIYGPLPDLPRISESATYKGPADSGIEDGASREHGEQEFEFRLFSTPAAAKREETLTQTILLVDENEELGDGGFVVTERDRGYYFAERASGERQLGFKMMALSGEDILGRAKKRAWGLEVPWRLRVLKVAGKEKPREISSEVTGTEEVEGDDKRKRPGKKRRIILRERRRRREELQERKKVELGKKEETEREKRTRRNREKKVKKKLKEKAKKLEDVTGESTFGSTEMEEPSDLIMENNVPDK